MSNERRLFVAIIYCKEFATFKQPMRPTVIVAVSHDEAMGKAIAEAKRTWTGSRYSEHNADVRPVSHEIIEQVRR